jgi:hypothetical protein
MTQDRQPDAASDARLGMGFRFSPQVIVFGLTFVAIFYAAQGAVVGFVHAWWRDSYRQVEFVMDEWRPNEGDPYIAGHLAGSGDDAPFHLPGSVVDGRRVLEEAPSIAFAERARVTVWWSDTAPAFSYGGETTNAIPVAVRPDLSGWGRVIAHGLMTIAVAVAGFAATAWVAVRFARRG